MMPEHKLKELMLLKANYGVVQKKFILPGFITANLDKEKCFENFLSPFGNFGNYVKVLFIIRIDTNEKAALRSTFINLCN
jgi:hypothetical protein